MSRRSDIGCAVIASGNVAVRQHNTEQGREADIKGYFDTNSSAFAPTTSFADSMDFKGRLYAVQAMQFFIEPGATTIAGAQVSFGGVSTPNLYRTGVHRGSAAISSHERSAPGGALPRGSLFRAAIASTASANRDTVLRRRTLWLTLRVTS